MTLPWFFLLHMGVSENLWYPQIVHVNRVFHCINHPFWGGYPYFRKHPYVVHVGSMWKPGPQPSKTSAPYPLPLSFPQPKRPKTRASWELKANLLLCGCVCGWGDGMGKLDEDVNDVSSWDDWKKLVEITKAQIWPFPADHKHPGDADITWMVLSPRSSDNSCWGPIFFKGGSPLISSRKTGNSKPGWPKIELKL